MAAARLEVDVSKVGETVLVKLIGEARLEVEAAGMQLDRVIVHHPKSVVVDCSKLTLLSSIGMSLFVNLRRSVVKNGGTVKLAGLQPMVSGALNHACLLPMFEIFPDIDSALAAEVKPAQTP